MKNLLIALVALTAVFAAVQSMPAGKCSYLQSAFDLFPEIAVFIEVS